MNRIIAVLICMAAVSLNFIPVSSQEQTLSCEEIPILTDDDTLGMAELGIMAGTPDGPELEREVTRAVYMAYGEACV